MIEDLTTYTKVDPNLQLGVTATRVTGNGVSRSGGNGVYLYKDFGASYFNGLSHQFTMRYSTGIQLNGIGGGIALSGALPTAGHAAQDFATTDIWVSIQHLTTWGLVLNRGSYVVHQQYPAAADLTIDTNYYCWLKRAAGSDTVTLEIYSDSGFTTLLTTLSVSGYGTSTTWRYLYAFINYDDGAAADVWDGWVENINLSAGVAWIRALSDSIMVSVSRFATVTRLAGYLWQPSDSMMNASVRLATVSRLASYSKGLSDSIMNGASRLATVTKGYARALSDSIMNGAARFTILTVIAPLHSIWKIVSNNITNWKNKTINSTIWNDKNRGQ